ncbi:uncharacterized protein [Rhodnius prolixus]|uniref:uncharacterized protein n=1 Tax=Rhodnius prolixus TaxID=13249 RepID=UPI003D18CD37
MQWLSCGVIVQEFQFTNLTGAQLLEDFRQRIKDVELKDTPSPVEYGTPVSRRISQIPKLCTKQITSTKTKNLKYSTNNKKECVLSSTLCSESSRKKTLLVPVQNDSLSPILKNSILDVNAETTLSSVESDDDFGPSSVLTDSRPAPLEETIQISRQSIDQVIAKYRILRKKLDDEE